MPLHDADIKKLVKLDFVKWGVGESAYNFTCLGLSVFAKAGNRMGIARRCNLARLFLTLRKCQWKWGVSVTPNSEVAQILFRVSNSIITALTHLNLPTKSTEVLTRPHIVEHFRMAISNADRIIEKSSEDPLVLPDDSIKELAREGLLE